jgi:hypothetical protein
MSILAGLSCGEGVAPPGGTCLLIGARAAVVAGEFMQLLCNKLIPDIARISNYISDLSGFVYPESIYGNFRRLVLSLYRKSGSVCLPRFC